MTANNAILPFLNNIIHTNLLTPALKIIKTKNNFNLQKNKKFFVKNEFFKLNLLFLFLKIKKQKNFKVIKNYFITLKFFSNLKVNLILFNFELLYFYLNCYLILIKNLQNKILTKKSFFLKFFIYRLQIHTTNYFLNFKKNFKLLNFLNLKKYKIKKDQLINFKLTKFNFINSYFFSFKNNLIVTDFYNFVKKKKLSYFFKKIKSNKLFLTYFTHKIGYLKSNLGFETQFESSQNENFSSLIINFNRNKQYKYFFHLRNIERKEVKNLQLNVQKFFFKTPFKDAIYQSLPFVVAEKKHSLFFKYYKHSNLRFQKYTLNKLKNINTIAYSFNFFASLITFKKYYSFLIFKKLFKTNKNFWFNTKTNFRINFLKFNFFNKKLIKNNQNKKIIVKFIQKYKILVKFNLINQKLNYFNNFKINTFNKNFFTFKVDNLSLKIKRKPFNIFFFKNKANFKFKFFFQFFKNLILKNFKINNFTNFKKLKKINFKNKYLLKNYYSFKFSNLNFNFFLKKKIDNKNLRIKELFYYNLQKLKKLNQIKLNLKNYFYYLNSTFNNKIIKKIKKFNKKKKKVKILIL